MGVDPIPRFYVEPQETLEVLKFSKKISSLKNGYKLDKTTGLYVKDIINVPEDDFTSQIDWVKMSPPYWFYNEATFEEFLTVNFDSSRSLYLESLFQAQDKAFFEKAEGVLPDSYYVEIKDWITKSFSEDVLVEWPKQKNITIKDISNL
tara:strand:+ start:2221 stop:2667 length:447 start_codon:yes stop_codon:yes gene_type:complete